MFTQKIDGETKVIEFNSHAFTDRKAAWTAFEKEAVAVVNAVEKWRHIVVRKARTLP